MTAHRDRRSTQVDDTASAVRRDQNLALGRASAVALLVTVALIVYLGTL